LLKSNELNAKVLNWQNGFTLIFIYEINIHLITNNIRYEKSETIVFLIHLSKQKNTTMRINITNAITLEELKAKIDQSFPHYQTNYRGKKILIVQKDKKTAALIIIGRKGNVNVNEGFPTMFGQIIFTLSMLLLGILIPLIIYFAAFFPAQKKLRNEMADFIKQTDGQISGSFNGENANLLDQK
jgi:hypothetical protein